MPSSSRDSSEASEQIESEAMHGDQQKPQRYRRIRIHKIKPSSLASDEKTSSDKSLHAAMDRRIAELIPGLAGLNVASSSAASLEVASEVRAKQLAKQDSMAEILELKTIYDMSKPHPLDDKPHEGPWDQQLRPRVRKVQLSPYQYEMINYQRLLMRKNTWYYRDRMNIPRCLFRPMPYILESPTNPHPDHPQGSLPPPCAQGCMGSGCGGRKHPRLGSGSLRLDPCQEH